MGDENCMNFFTDEIIQLNKEDRFKKSSTSKGN